MPLKLEVDLSKLTPELRRRLLSVLDDCAEHIGECATTNTTEERAKRT